MAAAAGMLSFGPAYAVVPAHAATGGGSNSPVTNTTTATCGNGLIALGPIIVPLAPNSTTVVQCEQSAPLPEVGR
jgi:hypothetical protein